MYSLGTHFSGMQNEVAALMLNISWLKMKKQVVDWQPDTGAPLFHFLFKFSIFKLIFQSFTAL